MSGGVNQVVAISPAVVSTGGRFHTSRTLTGIQAGGFTINATIVVNAFFLAGFFSCDDCNATCKAAPNCERGKFKDGPQEPYRGPVKTSTGDLWMQFRYQVYECNLHVCRVLGIACCEYNSWDEKGYAYKWKVSKKNPATGGPQIGANGDVVYEDPPPAVPCDCGGLIDIATAIGLAGGIDRPSEFKKAAADRCPGLSAEAASAMATKCGLADMWDTAMKGSAADWSEYAQKWLRLFGGSTPSIPRTP